MAFHQAVTPRTADNLSFGRMPVLSLAWLDRTIAVIACLPIVWLTYYRLEHWPMGIPLVAYVALNLLLIVTMIVRRPPVRVTPDPVYWLLTFVATYWSILILSVVQPGSPVAPQWFTDALAGVGLVITAWARLSLGRNIGFVPAQRELVSTGAYAFMRHPIYTGMLFMYLAFGLRAYTPRNALLLALGALWFIPIKSLVEESFLRRDPEYAAYMRKVRARWIPFVV